MPRKPTSRLSFQSYQNLEPRKMLASVSFDGGEVVVIGDATDDVIRLSGSNDFQSFVVRVNDDASLTQRFAYADVDRVTVFAGDGNDRLFSTVLVDTSIFGGDGDDIINGGFADDLLVGGDGDDVLNGRNGDDALNGGNGNDRLMGSSGADRLFGFDGIDVLFGGAGDDVLVGGNGDDRLAGDAGSDLLNGNGGDDSIFAGAGDDTVNGGIGEDLIVGLDGFNALNGNGDNDRIFGGIGADRIRGGSGDDLLAGGAGVDRIDGDAGVDSLFGGDGDDTLLGGTGNDILSGQNGDDVLSGDAGEDLQFGNDGDDLFLFPTENERINGGAGVDEVGQVFADQFDIRLDRVGADVVLTDLRMTSDPFFIDQLIFASIEQIDLLSEDDTLSIDSLIWQPIVERVFVQPIIVSDDDGSNTSPGFGNAEQEAEIQRRVDRIYNQAGVDVVFLPTRQFSDTFANGVGVGERNFNEFGEIIRRGDAAGVGSSDPLVLDYYFVNRNPGQVVSQLGSGGLAFVGQVGATQSVGELGLNFEFGRERVAAVFAHEIGHNFGLQHDFSDPPSLMTPTIPSNLLKDFQIRQVLNSRFSQPVGQEVGNEISSLQRAAIQNSQITQEGSQTSPFAADASDVPPCCGGLGCSVCSGTSS